MKDNWSSAHFCRISPKWKGSCLQSIYNAHTAFLLCGPEIHLSKDSEWLYVTHTNCPSALSDRTIIIKIDIVAMYKAGCDKSPVQLPNGAKRNSLGQPKVSRYSARMGNQNLRRNLGVNWKLCDYFKDFTDIHDILFQNRMKVISLTSFVPK